MVKPPTVPKGDFAEEELAAYFRSAGFYAVRGVPLRHDGEEVTDIDVWLYERGAGLGRRRFIVDSKNRKSPRAVERIFWASGLKQALDHDGAFVASSAVTEGTRRLGNRIGVKIIDLRVLTGGTRRHFDLATRISKDEMDRLIFQTDDLLATKLWRRNRTDILSALLTKFGGSSANVALRAADFFAKQALSAGDRSKPREIGVRMFYFAASAVAASLDFVAAQDAFRPGGERQLDLEEAIRYGTDPGETRSRLELALDLVRSFAPNGSNLANQIRHRIESASEEIPADLLAEVSNRMTSNGHLFDAARSLEEAAHSRTVLAMADLDTNARSVASAVLDFCGIERPLFSAASALIRANPAARATEPAEATEVGPLFRDQRPAKRS